MLHSTSAPHSLADRGAMTVKFARVNYGTGVNYEP